MFRIGVFSRLARVSVKALRHYDRLGLLRPARTDPLTGYRYYSGELVATPQSTRQGLTFLPALRNSYGQTLLQGQPDEARPRGVAS